MHISYKLKGIPRTPYELSLNINGAVFIFLDLLKGENLEDFIIKNGNKTIFKWESSKGVSKHPPHPLNYITGDALRTPDHALIHGCNSLGVMGSGIAKQIRAEYPKVYEEYHKHVVAIGVMAPELLGMVFPVYSAEKQFILNAITQGDVAKYPGHFVADYKAIFVAFLNATNFCLDTGIDALSTPRIGAGLAGGDWGLISALISLAVGGRITINVYTPAG